MTDPLRKSVVVRCSPARAFSAFTAEVDLWWPAGHKKFDGSRLAFDQGAFVETAPSGETFTLGEVVRWSPPDALVFTWWPGALDAPTTVEVTFTPEGETTRVDVIHSAGAAGDRFDKVMDIFVRSWDRVLGSYSQYIDESIEREA